MVLSSTDPWLALPQGQRWVARWGSACVMLGAAGHVNVASGHRTLPLAEHWLRTVSSSPYALREEASPHPFVPQGRAAA